MTLLPEAITQLVAQIHAAPHRLVLEFAGAGSLALFWLHSVGGSSRTVLEATDRYTLPALASLLGAPPAQAVAPATGLAMARAARARALHLEADRNRAPHESALPLLGVACTATIATDRRKRGTHRAVVAVQSAAGCRCWDLRLAQGQRDRLGEETLVSTLLLRAVAQGCGLEPLPQQDLHPDETLGETFIPNGTPLARLLTHAAQAVLLHPDGRREANPAVCEVLLVPGSFNPLHQGHEQLAAAASAWLGQPALFELTIDHPDKGALPAEEIERRGAQFAGRGSLLLSRAALFADKARLYPRCTFVVGYDTAVRLVQPHYYGGPAAMHTALEQVRTAGGRFLVAGRLHEDRFCTLADLEVPTSLRDLFLELPATHFRLDISSTALRAQAAPAQQPEEEC